MLPHIFSLFFCPIFPLPGYFVHQYCSVPGSCLSIIMYCRQLFLLGWKHSQSSEPSDFLLISLCICDTLELYLFLCFKHWLSLYESPLLIAELDSSQRSHHLVLPNIQGRGMWEAFPRKVNSMCKCRYICILSHVLNLLYKWKWSELNQKKSYWTELNLLGHDYVTRKIFYLIVIDKLISTVQLCYVIFLGIPSLLSRKKSSCPWGLERQYSVKSTCLAHSWPGINPQHLKWFPEHNYEWYLRTEPRGSPEHSQVLSKQNNKWFIFRHDLILYILVVYGRYYLREACSSQAKFSGLREQTDLQIPHHTQVILAQSSHLHSIPTRPHWLC